MGGKGTPARGRIPPPMREAREITGISDLARRAARVQELLKDLEVTLIAPGNKEPLAVLKELKGAWGAFRDAALAAAPSAGGVDGQH